MKFEAGPLDAFDPRGVGGYNSNWRKAGSIPSVVDGNPIFNKEIFERIQSLMTRTNEA